MKPMRVNKEAILMIKILLFPWWVKTFWRYTFQGHLNWSFLWEVHRLLQWGDPHMWLCHMISVLCFQFIFKNMKPKVEFLFQWENYISFHHIALKGKLRALNGAIVKEWCHFSCNIARHWSRIYFLLWNTAKALPKTWITKKSHLQWNLIFTG